MDPRYTMLLARFDGLEAAAVAFSGGADSTLLLAALRDALGAERTLALTAVTPYMVRQDIGDAIGLSAQLGVRHELVEIPMAEGMETNPTDRCYRCKRAMYGRLGEAAAELGYRTLFDGSNVNDAEDYRPGLRALRELGIRSPFLEVGIDKDAVRAIARELGLPTWHKPTNACLLTRIGYNTRFSMERLQQIEEAERFLAARGFGWVRVRCHGDLARIEVAPEQRARLVAESEAVIEALHRFGFRYVTMDLAGYQLGSMGEPGG
jgi:uncharacterized protein